MTATVTAMTTRRVHARLVRPWGPDVPGVTLVQTRLELSDGTVGHGLSWTPSIGGAAVQALLDDDVRRWLVGREVVTPETVWDGLWAHLHEAGSGGLTTIALAGVDLALWDARCLRDGTDLPGLLGRRHDVLPAYGSGVNLHYRLDELQDQVRRWVEAGFDAVKVKVGRPDVSEDCERLAAVREVLGPDRELMIDANQRWDLPTAVAAMQRLAAFDPAWIEEPLRADDTAGHVALRRETPVPVALGENAHTWYRFRDLLDAGACDVVQPNVVRVGGITPFLRVADLVRERGARLAPHLLPELSAQVAATLPEAVSIEVVEQAGLDDLGSLAEPTGVVARDGRVHVPPRTGLGLRLR